MISPDSPVKHLALVSLSVDRYFFRLKRSKASNHGEARQQYTHTPSQEAMLFTFTIKTQHKGGVPRAEREAETQHNKKLLPPFQEVDALIQYSPPFRRRRGERPRHSKTRNSSPLPSFLSWKCWRHVGDVLICRRFGPAMRVGADTQ